MKTQPKSVLVTLREGDTVRLNGLTVIEVVSIGTPLLKASISATPLNPNGEVSIFDNEIEDWKSVSDPEHFAVGLGDRFMVGNIQVLISAYSKAHKQIRLSMRTNDEKTEQFLNQLLNKLKGRQK